MIGAIGGTLGLCIGFSFMDCVSYMFKLIEGRMERIKNKRSSTGPEQESTVANPDFNITSRLERLEQFENRVELILQEMKANQFDIQAQLNALHKRLELE